MRSVVSGTFNVLLFLLYGLRVKDVDCALKLMRGEYLRSIELEKDESGETPDTAVRQVSEAFAEVECRGDRAPRGGAHSGGAAVAPLEYDPGQ